MIALGSSDTTSAVVGMASSVAVFVVSTLSSRVVSMTRVASASVPR